MTIRSKTIKITNIINAIPHAASCTELSALINALEKENGLQQYQHYSWDEVLYELNSVTHPEFPNEILNLLRQAYQDACHRWEQLTTFLLNIQSISTTNYIQPGAAI